MSETPNHDLNRPEDGARNWGEALNENFGQLDRILSGLSDDGKEALLDSIRAGNIVHKTTVEAGETMEIPEDHGTVIAGELTGEGEITGEGYLRVI